jgi:hypothetical protein
MQYGQKAVEYMTTLVIRPPFLFFHYWQICLPPRIDATRQVMHMRKPVTAQECAGFAGCINAAAMYQQNRLVLEFLKFLQTLFKLVRGNMP